MGKWNMRVALLLALVAHAAASPSVVAPFRQRPSARQAMTLRGGLGKEAPSRQATAPFAALVAAHGVVIAGYGGGTLGLGAGSALVACAVVSMSEVYKPYMIGARRSPRARRGDRRVWRPVPDIQRAEDARRLCVGGRAPLRRHVRPLSWSALRREQVQAKDCQGGRTAYRLISAGEAGVKVRLCSRVK